MVAIFKEDNISLIMSKMIDANIECSICHIPPYLIIEGEFTECMLGIAQSVHESIDLNDYVHEMNQLIALNNPQQSDYD